MTAKNDITNDLILSIPTKAYQDNFSKIDFSVKLETKKPKSHANHLLKDDEMGFDNEGENANA